MSRVVCLVTSLLLLFTCAGRANAGATTRRSAIPSRIDLPSNWVARPLPRGAIQFAYEPDLLAFCKLSVTSGQDVDESMDLVAFARLSKESNDHVTEILRLEEGDLKRTTIAGHPVVEYEMRAECKGVKFRFRFMMLHFGGNFYEVSCYAVPSHWDESNRQFEQLIANFQRPQR